MMSDDERKKLGTEANCLRDDLQELFQSKDEKSFTEKDVRLIGALNFRLGWLIKQLET